MIELLLLGVVGYVGYHVLTDPGAVALPGTTKVQSGEWRNGHGQKWSSARPFTVRYEVPAGSDSWSNGGAFASKAEAVSMVRDLMKHSGVRTAYVANENADRIVWDVEDGKVRPSGTPR